MQGELFDETFWAGSPFRVNDEAELGIADMAKGNYVSAEAHFKRALRTNPRDIDALIGAGILYQNTGQMIKSRQMYEAVLALHPDESHQFVIWNNIETKPAAQIASVNLSLLETGGTPSGAASTLITPPGQPLEDSVKQQPKIMKEQTQSLNREIPAVKSPPPSVNYNLVKSDEIGTFTGKDANIISRFTTLRALRDQNLLTQREFIKRRQVNIGALLPLTSPPPSAGLERPVPTTDQVAGRFRAIARALEMRAISVQQHAAERSMILDALMPSAPVVISSPAVPPRGLMQAADAVRRLEKLKNSGYINKDEYARERQAVELAIRPPTPIRSLKQKKQSTNSVKKELAEKQPRKVSRPAVHLASYRTTNQANRGWSQIKRAHRSLVGALEHMVKRVNLGKKGTYYRLIVGPLPSIAAAKSMCRKLKRRRQFCEPSMMIAG
jgi:hypothetical protein